MASDARQSAPAPLPPRDGHEHPASAGQPSTSRQERAGLFGIDGDDHFDLDRDVERELGHPHGRAGVATDLIAEHFD